MSWDILCYGEMLWDMLPQGKVAGGAPMNVAMHAHQQGAQSGLISRVGFDELGNELMETLNGWGMDLAFVQKDISHPTGTVDVVLDDEGKATYNIHKNVAWDYIQSDIAIARAISVAKFFVFGSLASRNLESRETLKDLVGWSSFPVLDLNLRAPFYTPELVGQLLDLAKGMKVNDEEFELLAEWFGLEDVDSMRAVQLQERFGMDWICVTRGSAGATLYTKDEVIHQTGFSVDVTDTVGSGDAFLAGFLTCLAKGGTYAESLQTASALGAMVAQYPGATPEIATSQLQSFIAESTLPSA